MSSSSPASKGHSALRKRAVPAGGVRNAYKAAGKVYTAPEVPGTWQPPNATAEAFRSSPVLYVDAMQNVYTHDYALVGNVAALLSTPCIEFPNVEQFTDMDAFVLAVSVWTARVTAQLGKLVLPTAMSRVWCRPSVVLGDDTLDDTESTHEEEFNFTDTTDDASSLTPPPLTLTPPQQRILAGALSPRARPMRPESRDMASPRGRRESREPLSPRSRDSLTHTPSRQMSSNQLLAQKRGVEQASEWRAALAPCAPNAPRDSDTYRRWCWVVTHNTPMLPPHPAALRAILGIGSTQHAAQTSKTVDVAESLLFRAVASTQQRASSAPARTALVPFDAIVAAAERGTDWLPITLRPRAEIDWSTMPRSAEPEPGKLATATPSTIRKLGAGAALGRKSQISRVANASAAPASPAMMRRDRIAMVDLSNSEDDSSSSDSLGDDGEDYGDGGDYTVRDSGASSGRTPTIVTTPTNAVYGKYESVPDVPLGNPAVSSHMAMLRAQRLWGNVYSALVQRFLARGVFCEPVAYVPRKGGAGAKASTVFGVNVAALVRESDYDMGAIDLARLESDEAYGTVLRLAVRAQRTCVQWAALLGGAAAKPLDERFTLEQLDAFLLQRCDLASFAELLQAKTRAVFSAVNAQGVSVALPADGTVTTTAAAVVWGATHLLGAGDASVLSGVAQLVRLLSDWRDAQAVLHVAASLVYGLPSYLSALAHSKAAVPLSTLYGIARAFSLCDAAPRALFPPATDLFALLAQQPGAGPATAAFCEALLREYYLAYVGAYRGSHGMSTAVYIAWNGMALNQSDRTAAVHRDMMNDAGAMAALCDCLLDMLTRQPHSAVVSLQAAFMLARVLDRKGVVELLCGATVDAAYSLPQLLFNAKANLSRRAFVTTLFANVLQGVAADKAKRQCISSFYAARVPLLVSHITCAKADHPYADWLLVPTAQRVMAGVDDEKTAHLCMMFSSSKSSNFLAGVATSHVFNCICQSAATHLTGRMAKLLWLFIPVILNTRLVTVNESTVDLLAALPQLSNEGQTMMVQFATALLRTPALHAQLHPSARNGVLWRAIVELCRGAALRSGGADGTDDASRSQRAALLQSTSTLTTTSPSSASHNVSLELNTAAWEFVKTYMKTVPDGCSYLIASRHMATLISMVAAKSAPGVASSALMCLADVLDSRDLSDAEARHREKDTRPLVAMLAEKRFHVQVHLLYRRQGSDLPRNLLALARWACVVLESPLLAKLAKGLQSTKEDEEYLTELRVLSRLRAQ